MDDAIPSLIELVRYGVLGEIRKLLMLSVPLLAIDEACASVDCSKEASLLASQRSKADVDALRCFSVSGKRSFRCR